MKGIMILADGFEDTEGLATLDILRRGKLEVTTVSINMTNDVKTQYNVFLKTDAVITEINYHDYDFLIIPGGGAVSRILKGQQVIEQILKYFYTEGKLIALICAAPLLLGRLGYLQRERFTCYPSCEEEILGGTYLKNEGVVVSNNIITAKSMAYSIDFALSIIEYLCGSILKDTVRSSIYGE